LLSILDSYSGFTNTIKAKSDSKLEEGITINQKKGNENPRNKSFTCPNPSCGRVFAHPIKAENLALKNKVYNACPYCLTEITVEKSAITAEEEEREKLETSGEKEGKRRESLVLEKVSVEPNKPGCTHQFGYLSQRSTKEKIPEECMMCEKIVQCMLQGVRG
jgi:hypothetical protein